MWQGHVIFNSASNCFIFFCASLHQPSLECMCQGRRNIMTRCIFTDTSRAVIEKLINRKRCEKQNIVGVRVTMRQKPLWLSLNVFITVKRFFFYLELPCNKWRIILLATLNRMKQKTVYPVRTAQYIVTVLLGQFEYLQCEYQWQRCKQYTLSMQVLYNPSMYSTANERIQPVRECTTQHFGAHCTLIPEGAPSNALS